MPYVPDADDIYEIAFLVSRGWKKQFDNWYKYGMKQRFNSEQVVPEKKYTKTFSQKEAFDAENYNEPIDDDDYLINNNFIQKPLDSDFDTLSSLMSDLKSFAADNLEHVFICCDYATGIKGPRLGWVAFIPNAEDEKAKEWTITVNNAIKAKSNFINCDTPLSRQSMLDLTVLHARGET